jgi:hypothetical protein
MLQVLYIDVAKVYPDIAYVVMAIHVYFKCMFQMFHLFETNVASVLSGCCKSRSRCCTYMHFTRICFKCFQVFHIYVCKCFIWMLLIFAMVFKYFSDVFANVSFVFICMLQLLHLDILKVDPVLHNGCA